MVELVDCRNSSGLKKSGVFCGTSLERFCTGMRTIQGPWLSKKIAFLLILRAMGHSRGRVSRALARQQDDQLKTKPKRNIVEFFHLLRLSGNQVVC